MRGTNSNRVIAELEQAGYTVRVQHYRIKEEDWEMYAKRRRDPDFVRALYPTFLLKQRGEAPAAKGGGTGVNIMLGNRIIAHGETVCNPIDPFNRKIGVQIALGRAIRNLKPSGQRKMLRAQLLAALNAIDAMDNADEKIAAYAELESLTGGGGA